MSLMDIEPGSNRFFSAFKQSDNTCLGRIPGINVWAQQRIIDDNVNELAGDLAQLGYSIIQGVVTTSGELLESPEGARILFLPLSKAEANEPEECTLYQTNRPLAGLAQQLSELGFQVGTINTDRPWGQSLPVKDPHGRLSYVYQLNTEYKPATP